MMANMDLPPPNVDTAPKLWSDLVNNPITRVWRRRKLFWPVSALIFTASVGVAFLWPASYFADGTVIVGEQEAASSSASPAWLQKLGDPADLESQLLIIRSPRMLRLALARAGVLEAVQRECQQLAGFIWPSRWPRCFELAPGSQRLIEHVEAHYSVRALGRSRIISIGYASRIADIAFVMANALLLTYLEDQRAENAQNRGESASWLLEEAKRLTPERPDIAVQIASGRPDATAHDRQRQFLVELYNKATDLETERRTLLSSARLVSLAELPRFPYFPKRVPILAGGLTLALLLGALASLWQDASDRTLRGTRQLEAATGVPVLGRVPRLELRHTISGQDKDWDALARSRLPWRGTRRGQGWRATFCEAVRRLSWIRRVLSRSDETIPFRDGLDAGRRPGVMWREIDKLLANVLVVGGRSRRILVLSALQGEGKSFITLSVARAAANAGRKILVIDCNFRHPSVADGLKLAESRGLADVLRGEIDASKVIIRTAFDRLEVLTAGTNLEESSTLLIDGDLGNVLRRVDQYDLILLDGLSTDQDPETRLLARHADAVLLCARWGFAVPEHTQRAVEELRKERINVLGLVVTMVDFAEIRFYERQHSLSPV